MKPTPSPSFSEPLLDLSARALSQAIQKREVSCVEVMQATLAQIERFNPEVNALVGLRPADALLQEARARDQSLSQTSQRHQPRGWLYGLPQAPKDLSPVAGLPYTQGSPVLARQVAPRDNLMTARLRAAGAIFIGKTNTPEFGLGSHTYNPVHGTTRNAWDSRWSAGGSSGGAAVALALNLLSVADGSDMMGSLRNPAGWNHVYGLRPSLGRVPKGPDPDLFFQQLGTEGPMARNPQDLAWMLATQAGFDARAPLSLSGSGLEAGFMGSLDTNLKGRRIAWLGNLNGYLAMDPGVLPLCEAALGHFQTLGLEVEALVPDFNYERLWTTWLHLRGFTVAGQLQALYANPKTRQQLKPEAQWEAEQGQGLSASDVYTASVWRTSWYQRLLACFDQFDYLVLPSAQTFPFAAELTWPTEVGGRAMDTYHRWMEVTLYASLAGLPTLGLPAGFSEAGQPMGLQVIGRPRDELSLLQLAQAWHQAAPFMARRPPRLAAAGGSTPASHASSGDSDRVHK